MTGSRSKNAFWFRGLALVLCAAITPAGAQPAGGGGEPPAAETTAGDVSQRTLAPAAGDRDGAAVEIQDLTAPDPNAAGALPSGVRPMGAGMWKTVDADALASKLDRLPAFDRSAVMQALTARMLLSPSAGPKNGRTDGVAPWYVARLRALNARGDWTGAIALAEYGPMTDPQVAEASLAARLLARPREETCETLKAIETPHEGQFWSQLRIFCQFVAGDLEGAQLALDVLKEKGVNDPPFSAAAAKLTSGKAPAVLPAPETAVHAAMWRLAALPLNAQAARDERPEIATLADASAGDPILALAGVGARARRSATAAQAWQAAIGDWQPSADLKDDPEEAAKKVPVAVGDAIFVKAISSRTMPAAKASAFAAMLQRGQSRGEFPYTAKLLSRAAAEIAPLPETAWAAPEVTRVLIYNGDVARAETWFKALSPGSPSDQPTINAVQIYGWLRQPNEARAAVLDKALRWLAETSSKPGPNKSVAQARLAREAPVLAALGVVLPLDAMTYAEANSPGVALGIDGPALLDGMAQAADQGAAGEVVLNAALLLNGQGAAAARSQTVAAIVRALMKTGLRQEAKALALEALLGHGQRGL